MKKKGGTKLPLKEKLYQYNVAILKDYGGIKTKLSIHNVLRTKGLEVDIIKNDRCTVNDEKLLCNITRAKQKIFEYAYCNDWQYFVTLTIDEKKYDRTNLKKYYNDFSIFLRNYGARNNIKISYLFIPELHKDKKSWHMHGFIMGLPIEHLQINSNGYLDWFSYSKKFGYISLDFIKDKEKCSSYITKYISKNLSDCVADLNAKMYYCSKGLKTATEIKRGTMLCDIVPDFENEYVKVQWFDKTTSLNTLKNMID